MEQIFINATDGYKLDLNIYSCVNPKGVIQVIHGMEEYQDRYQYLANKLSNNGYIVVTSNMRGHGKYAPKLGYFCKKRGDLQLIQDQKTILEYIKSTFKNLPINIFAHSMGTIITRNLLQDTSNEYNKVILCGYPNYIGAAKIGVLLARIIKTFKGKEAKSKLLQGIAIDPFNKQIKNPRTKSDWLSYNEENVDKYLSDPLCGFGFATSSYEALFRLMSNMHNKKLFKNVNKELPVFLISGEDDPCTGGNKGVCATYKALKEIGFNVLSPKIYEHARHEILNEDIKDLVISDCLNFLENN